LKQKSKNHNIFYLMIRQSFGQYISSIAGILGQSSLWYVLHAILNVNHPEPLISQARVNMISWLDINDIISVFDEAELHTDEFESFLSYIIQKQQSGLDHPAGFL
jgi:hypothetical protein